MSLECEWQVLSVGEYYEIGALVTSLVTTSKGGFAVAQELMDVYRKLIVRVEGFQEPSKVPMTYVWPLIRHALESQSGSDEDAAEMRRIGYEMGMGRSPSGHPTMVRWGYEMLLMKELQLGPSEIVRELNSEQSYENVVTLVMGMKQTLSRTQFLVGALLKYQITHEDALEDMEMIEQDLRKLVDCANRLRFDLTEGADE